jgi:hypothetical protein
MTNEQDAVVTQHRTHDPELCPVRLWAAIAKQILSYLGTDIHTSVNTYMHKGKLKEGTSKMILNRLRAVVCHVGEDNLGFKGSEMGTQPLHDPIWCCHGDVPRQHSSVHNHAYRLLVQRRISSIHTSTSTGVQLAGCGLQNDHILRFLHDPRFYPSQ